MNAIDRAEQNGYEVWQEVGRLRAQHDILFAACERQNADIGRVLDMCQQHDQATGHFRPVSVYDILIALRPAYAIGHRALEFTKE